MPDPTPSLRILLLADSHLGFDHPARPRVKRRRRGPDFLANHCSALRPALEGRADLVVHGGDLFHRPRVPPSLAYQALKPLVEIAEKGIPVFVVPGNHERSRIPHHHLAGHPGIHLFHAPETVLLEVRGIRVGVAGFPYHRRDIRRRFHRVLEGTGWREKEADVRLLCFHHCVEGARVGPADFQFRSARDVIRCGDLPSDFAGVLSGHIHRHQILRQDLRGRPLPTPVFYPGSVERTAFAEVGEKKGYMLLRAEPTGRGGTIVSQGFVALPARPMSELDLHPGRGPEGVWTRRALERGIRAALARAPADAVLRVRVHGQVSPEARAVLTGARLRDVRPARMNLEVVVVADRSGFFRRTRTPGSGAGRVDEGHPPRSPQLPLIPGLE